MLRIVLIAEFEDCETAEDAEERLDRFREATLPTIEHGVTIYRATRSDLEEFAEAGCLLPTPAPLDQG